MRYLIAVLLLSGCHACTVEVELSTLCYAAKIRINVDNQTECNNLLKTKGEQNEP